MPFSPSNISGNVLWIEPQQNNSSVDLSGAGNDFSVLGSTPTPAISTAAFNGSKSLLFTGTEAIGRPNTASLTTLQAGSYTFAFLVQPTTHTQDLNTFFAHGGGGPSRLWLMGRSLATGMYPVDGGYLQNYLNQQAQVVGRGRNTQLVANSPHVVTLQFELLSEVFCRQTLRVDGQIASTFEGFPPAPETVKPWSLGCGVANDGSPNWFGKFHLGLALGYNRALSVSETEALELYAATLGGFQLPQFDLGLILIDGDSIAYSAQPDTGDGWPVLAAKMFRTRPRIYNRAIGGRTLTQIVARFIADGGGDGDFSMQLLPQIEGQAMRAAILTAGTNDIVQLNLNDTQLFALLTTHCNTMSSLGFPVVVGTILPRANMDATMNGYRLAYNQKVRDALNNRTLPIAAVADFALIPELQNTGDLTYYNDGTHPKVRGQALMAVVGQRAIINAAPSIDTLPPALSEADIARFIEAYKADSGLRSAHPLLRILEVQNSADGATIVYKNAADNAVDGATIVEYETIAGQKRVASVVVD